MEEALRHAAKWQKKYHNISVSFNVSYIQLLDGEFINRLIAKARELQVNPRLIMVELTESCNANDTKMLSRQFSKLQKLGFKIALDDYGTDYTSFGLLHDGSIDGQIIAQNFVRGLIHEGNRTDMAIFEIVVNICWQLSIQTIAEGIETEEIQDIVSSIGVSYLQGYLYSRPVPASKFEQMLMEEQN